MPGGSQSTITRLRRLKSQEKSCSLEYSQQELRTYIPDTPFAISADLCPCQLGNYLGALSNWVKLQQDATPDDQLLFSIVGWHALTMPQDPKALRTGRTEMLAALLAIGLNPDRCIIFHQDHVSSCARRDNMLTDSDYRICTIRNWRGY